MFNAITDIDGIKVGHASNLEGFTGCTVILCEEGATGGIDVRGSAAGTRQTNSLESQHLVEEVHAVLLSGGSAFGLDAGGGVLKYLEERGKGFPTSAVKVPIVPTAIIYDLSFGSQKIRPDREMGYMACKGAISGLRFKRCPQDSLLWAIFQEMMRTFSAFQVNRTIEPL